MNKVLFVFLILSSSLDAQIHILKDTIVLSHSRDGGVNGGEIEMRYFFVNAEDSDNVKQLNLFNGKYNPIPHRHYYKKGQKGGLEFAEDIIGIKVHELYPYVFPFTSYRIKRNQLWVNGIELVGLNGRSIENFGSVKPVIINFYENNRAVFYKEYQDLKVSGNSLQAVFELFHFDRLEIVICNEFQDTIKLNFYLE